MSTPAIKNPLLHLSRTYFLPRTQVLLSVVLVGFIAVTELVNPWLVMKAIDIMIGSEQSAAHANIDERFKIILIISGGITVIVLAQYLARYALAKVQNRIIYAGAARLRADLYERLLSMSLNFHNQHRVGAILTNLVTDIQILQDAVLDLISELPFDFCSLLGLLSVMFVLNPVLAAIVAGFLFVVILISVRVGRDGIESQQAAMDDASVLTSRMQESLSAVRVIQSFGATASENGKLAADATNHAAALEEAGETRAAVTPFFSVAEYAGILIVLTVGGWCVLHGTLTAGGLVAFLAYMEMAADPMTRGAQMLPKGQKAFVSASRICSALEESAQSQIPSGHLKPTTLKGSVSFKNVGFQYPRGVRPALKEISFNVQPGEKIAVIGANAAGKSTLLDLLLKLQRPDCGEVEIDGMSLQDISTESWRALVGLVPQEILLLNRTISENISLGLSKMSEVRDAAVLAGLDEPIMRLPNGYDTVPGERGVCLSGGERQRVAIARLFLRNPPIVLLDEPTSSLDVRSERELIPALQRLCAGRTTFIVSHRLAILESVDKVLLLSGGTVLAFDVPGFVYERFPEFRDLFPRSWEQPAEAQLSTRGS